MNGETFTQEDVFYVLVEELVDEQGEITAIKVVGLISDGSHADLWADGKHRKVFRGRLEEVNLAGFEGGN